MTDRPDRDPEATWEALEQLALDADAAEIAAMNEEELDAELRAHGIDPAKAALVGQDLIEKAARDAGVTLPKTTPQAPAPAAPKEPAPRPAASRPRTPVVMALFGGALAVIVGVAATSPQLAGSAPDNASRALELRDEGIAACQAKAWQDCLTKLDEARRFDPTIEDDVVRDARAAATRALTAVPKTPHE